MLGGYFILPHPVHIHFPSHLTYVTLLNTDVPNCRITLECIILAQYLMTELSHSKPRYGLFNKAVSSTTYWLNIVRIYARNVPRVH